MSDFLAMLGYINEAISHNIIFVQYFIQNKENLAD